MKTPQPSSFKMRRSFWLIGTDVFFALASMMMVIRWRYDFLNEPLRGNIDHKAAYIAAAATLIIWVGLRQDRSIWRFTTLHDFKRISFGIIGVSLTVPLVLYFFFDRGANFPRTAPVMFAALFFGLIIASRLLAMLIQNGDFRALFRARSTYGQDALLVGPAPHLYNYLMDRARKGAKGKNQHLGFNPVGLIETSGLYEGRTIRSVPVLGGPDNLQDIYLKTTGRQEKPLQIIAVDPNPDRRMTAKLVKIAAELGAPLSRRSTDPSLGLSAFEASDLIGRDMRVLDLEPVRNLFAGRRVLVTGAGGSIGSELSRQIAQLNPATLILVDNSEFHLYNLEKKLKSNAADGAVECWKTFIGDVRNAPRMREIFSVEKPEIVLHAAALKHVPLGQKNPLEVLRTNVMGTSNILDMCDTAKVEHFILISTDKAVAPVNMMGASKRIVEMLTLSRQAMNPGLQASCVRFGNVLSSNGSAVNLFEEQIAMGGPVTVTHREVERYFMMLEEAAALVLQSAALGSKRRSDAREGHDSSACIYVLEMGEPVNIGRLARQLIRLRGKVPDVDIEVRYTGLRPGEKLTEVLSYEDEDLAPTDIDGIQLYNGAVLDPASVLRRVKNLIRALNSRDRAAIRKIIAQLVPGYDPAHVLDEPELAIVPNVADQDDVANDVDDSKASGGIA
ncbi:polysaccharide biosynthesis protein CapD [Litorimonas cladophorae]|uniref:Polysaccharide biosynthesis protein CapD n=1 Tax=Litorimonas cladophorae TaxID=1220491 RepID=A0A918KNN2_9PROT|nr:polysaccharide biosynthesis protein [Litorimonas cladophorae]GGX67901.1 polysaccharide biosynthesis protein CapD [Litorimonas cladophorae]